jgi:hypothetical protein
MKMDKRNIFLLKYYFTKSILCKCFIWTQKLFLQRIAKKKKNFENFGKRIYRAHGYYDTRVI